MRRGHKSIQNIRLIRNMRRGHKSIQNIRLIRLIIRQALLGASSFANANICKTILDLAHILLKHACTHLQLIVGIHARRLHAMFAPGRDQNVNETEKIHKTHKKHNTDNTGIRFIRRIRKNGFLQLRCTRHPQVSLHHKFSTRVTTAKGSTLRNSTKYGQAGTRCESNSITIIILSPVMYSTVPTRPPSFVCQQRCSTRSPTFVLRKLRKLGKLRTQTIRIKKTKNIEN